MVSIDLNSDLGEGFGAWRMGDDEAMLEIVSSASIACGFHAGDPAGILRTLKAAKQRGVAIGAHVGYRDLAGFGRRDMSPSSEELVADVIYQIGALRGLAAAAGASVSYVKPHGALYNRIAYDERQAADIIRAIRMIDPSLILVALAASPLVEQARAGGLTVVSEAFADRAYKPDGTLVSRNEPGAVLHDSSEVSRRMILLAKSGEIAASDGKMLKLDAQTICVHGDTKSAVSIALAVRQALESEDIAIKSFAGK